MNQMKLRNQIILVNFCIALALGYEAIRGTSVVILLIVGVFLYLLVNVIFWYRVKKSKS